MFWLSRRLACVTMIVVPWFVIASRSHAKCGVDSRARAPPLCPGGMGSLVHPLPSREWNLPFAIPFHQLYADRQPQQPSGATLYALHIHCPNRIFDRYDLVAPLDTTNIIIWARLNRCPKFRTGALSLPVTDMFQYIKKVASSQPVGMPPVRLLATEAAAVLRHPEQCIQSAGRAPLVKRGARETCRDVRHVLEATC
jgi:hypothetical protein